MDGDRREKVGKAGESTAVWHAQEREGVGVVRTTRSEARFVAFGSVLSVTSSRSCHITNHTT